MRLHEIVSGTMRMVSGMTIRYGVIQITLVTLSMET